MINLWALAVFAASITSEAVAVGLPKAMLLNTVSLNKIASCDTIPIIARKSAILCSFMLIESIRIAPFSMS